MTVKLMRAHEVEKEAGEKLARHLGARFELESDDSCFWDGRLVRQDKLLALVEVKERHKVGPYFGFYTTYHVSLKKVNRCLRAAAERKAAFVLVFKTTVDAGTWAVVLKPEEVSKMEIHMSGRTDRGLRGDIEEMVRIPAKKFVKVD